MISQHTIERLNKGDEIAFKEIYGLLYGELWGYINKHYSSLPKEDLQEVLSYVFIQIWNNRGKYPDELSLRGYVYTTLKNASLNLIRTNLTRMKYESNGFNIEPDQEKEEDIKHSLPLKMSPIEAIQYLPEKRREYFTKFFLQEIPLTKIARDHNIAYQTLKNLVYLAKEQIKEIVLNGRPPEKITATSIADEKREARKRRDQEIKESTLSNGVLARKYNLTVGAISRIKNRPLPTEKCG
jgi:RNA polymerase sigma-70 factor, ECF subfamily